MIKTLTLIRFSLCMMIFVHHAYGDATGGVPAVAERGAMRFLLIGRMLKFEML